MWENENIIIISEKNDITYMGNFQFETKQFFFILKSYLRGGNKGAARERERWMTIRREREGKKRER